MWSFADGPSLTGPVRKKYDSKNILQLRQGKIKQVLSSQLLPDNHACYKILVKPHRIGWPQHHTNLPPTPE